MDPKNDLDPLKVLAYAQSLPTNIGKYQVINLLGQGGMGKVYSAFDPKLNRIVAIKQITLSLDKKIQEKRILKEAQACAGLTHPNIITVYEVTEDSVGCYLVMEYIKGISLDKYLKEKSPDLESILKLMKIICEAVHYAHKQEVVHRDLKPSNIMMMGDVPKIMDFGLAKMMNEETSTSSRGKMIGTIYYMAPEQILPTNPTKIGPHSDVYALGVILYELLTHTRPFQGNACVEIAVKIAHDLPTFPKKNNIPKEVKRICLKCLEKNPRNRYLSAYSLSLDIERFLNKYKDNNQKVIKKNYIIYFFILLLIVSFFFMLLEIAKWNNKFPPPVPLSVEHKTEIYQVLDTIWENLHTPVKVEWVEEQLNCAEKIAPFNEDVYREIGKIWMVLALRQQKDEFYAISKALQEFDRAIAVSQGQDWQSCFLADNICIYFKIAQKHQAKYIEYLKKFPEFSQYIQLRKSFYSIFFATTQDERMNFIHTGLDFCGKLSKEYPNRFWVHYWAMKFFIEDEKYKSVLYHCTEAMKIYYDVFDFDFNPKHPNLKILTPLYFELCYVSIIALLNLKEYNLALQRIDHLFLYRQEANLYYYQAQCYFGLEKWESAIQTLNRAEELGVPIDRIAFSRGKCYILLKKYKEALENFDLVIKNSKKEDIHYTHYYMRSQLYKYFQRYDDALEDLDSALLLEPQNQDILEQIQEVQDLKAKQKKK